MIKIMIVEDDQAFLNYMCRTITSDSDLELFAAVRDGTSALQNLALDKPDVLLVDLGLPDMNGIKVIQHAANKYPELDIMVISIFEDQQNVLTSIESGATGYLLKDNIMQCLTHSIKQLHAGGSPISPLIARSLLKKLCPPTLLSTKPDKEYPQLSVRESETLTFLAKGFSFTEIATLLEISPHTVATHIKKIYQKLAVHSRGEAVYEASKMGLLRTTV